MSTLLAASVSVHPTIPDVIVFALGAAIILAGAIGVVTARNPVHSALMLVMTLFGVAVLFVEQKADFLAAVQVIVYAGAIVVLFLFVIMFLGVDRQENLESEPLRGQRPLALALVVVAIGSVLALAASAHWVTGVPAVSGTTQGSNVADIGRSVFTTYLFAFEATAALLVIAVVGAVVLARRPLRPPEEPEGEGGERPVASEAGPGASGATGDGEGADERAGGLDGLSDDSEEEAGGSWAPRPTEEVSP